ncbi:CD1375 family protein [Desulfosporosinus nitroreducens]|nr:CD1375 family protein [Desulfosporosinus nitroreducens]
MVEMYFKLVKEGRRQMTPSGLLVQVPEKYLADVQTMLDAQNVS